jgi:hypothetical protein
MVAFGCNCGTNERKEHIQHSGKESFWMTDEDLVDNIKMDLMKMGWEEDKACSRPCSLKGVELLGSITRYY